MREILFRGKKVENGEWVYGDLLQYGETVKGIRNYGLKTIYRVIPETVGQYIGLADKNGNKIFEGDIFKFDDEVWESCYTSCGTEYDSFEVENYGVVGFAEYMARFDFIKYKFNENSVEADLHDNHSIDFFEFVSELEVVGNIHDNMELLDRGEVE